MTTVVGVLNKQGAAIAADSAVTVGNQDKRKTYNTANKIFTLSKYHPVGVAIYSSAEFMGIPWETIIKMYREQLGDRKFDNLKGYKENFFKWFSDNNYLVKSNNQNKLLKADFQYYFFSLVKRALNNNRRVKTINNLVLKEVSNLKNHILQKYKKLSNFELEKSKIRNLLSERLNLLINNFNSSSDFKIDNDKVSDKVINCYLEILGTNHFTQSTGLIFIGYGDKQIFPRISTTNIANAVDGRLRKYDLPSKTAQIKHNNISCIIPFAQDDVVNTLLRGVSNATLELHTKTFTKFTEKLLNEILEIEEIPDSAKKKINNINSNDYIKSFKENVHNFIRKEYVSDLMSAVAQLSKEDLAEMAESLVYLTYLKRRMTMAEESVGGPVDVAVLTKGDGFIWIKRKHYFDPDLNQSFFQKYFK